jgi:ABC-type sugar transport system ATPase subunit
MTNDEHGIAVEDLGIRAGSFSLAGLNFEIPGGEYAVLMGRTGSGKTTILESLCGLRPVTAGRIKLAGRDVTGLRPADRGIGYVPQDRALFKTMTVREHLAFSLVVRKWESRLIAQRVEELSTWLGLEKLLERRPEGLSGGEAQRVALGRALAMRPLLLLLDEPLSALDDQTREETYAVLRSVRAQTGVTVLHVTHSRAEFEALATRLLVLDNGNIREGKIECLSTAPRK